MTRYEYKMVPAPLRGMKAKGVKTPEARFAHAVENAINALAADGWEYLRTDTLPHEERHGLTGSSTTFRSLMVFRRHVGSKGATSAAQAPASTEDVAPVEMTPQDQPAKTPTVTPASPPVIPPISADEMSDPPMTRSEEATPRMAQSVEVTPDAAAETLVRRDDDDAARER